MTNLVNIAPFNFGPGKTATKFEVKSFSGNIHGNVTFACAAKTAEVAQVFDEDGQVQTPFQPSIELAQHMVNVTPEQFDSWTDSDQLFFELLATLTGYTPV